MLRLAGSVATMCVTMSLVAAGRLLSHAPVRRILAMLVCLCVLAASSVAAAETAYPTAGAVSELLSLVIQVAGVVIMAIVTLVMRRWLGPKVGVARLQAFERIADQSIRYAEEWAQKRVKENMPRPSGSEKLEQASTMLLSMAYRLGLNEFEPDDARRVIESCLDSHRTVAREVYGDGVVPEEN